MTLPQIICTSAGIWLFLAIGMAVSAYRESKRLKDKINADKVDPDEDDIDWDGLGIQQSEQPFIYRHPWSN